jgi:hypothetical protein
MNARILGAAPEAARAYAKDLRENAILGLRLRRPRRIEEAERWEQLADTAEAEAKQTIDPKRERKSRQRPNGHEKTSWRDIRSACRPSRYRRRCSRTTAGA